MSETKNHLGLDKFQVTVIKSNYNSIKPFLKKIEKAQAKIDAAKQKYEEAIADSQKEVAQCQDQISLMDQYTIGMTTKSCGVGLTIEQTIKYLEDAPAFEEYKKSIGISDMFANTENVEEKVSGDAAPAAEEKEEEKENV